MKVQMMGKAATPFSVFVERWKGEVLIHKKASTTAAINSHINTLLLPALGKLAMGDVDSERVQSFLNRNMANRSAKTVKNLDDAADHVELCRGLEIRFRRVACSAPKGEKT